MDNYYVQEEDDHFVLCRPDGIWRTLTWEEMKAVERFFANRRYEAQIDRQIDEDEDSLDFTGDISREDFLGLCMDAIKAGTDIYGDDYVPDIAEVVFSTAQEYEVWRP